VTGEEEAKRGAKSEHQSGPKQVDKRNPFVAFTECAKIGILRESAGDSSRLHTSAKYGIGVEGSRVVILMEESSAKGKNGGSSTRRAVLCGCSFRCSPSTRDAFTTPCCGSGGMFVQSEKFVKAHGGLLVDISFFGLAA
jgi:hypothetical protein